MAQIVGFTRGRVFLFFFLFFCMPLPGVKSDEKAKKLTAYLWLGFES